MSTFWTIFVRQIEPIFNAIIRKIRIFAIRTTIMRFERIYLRNTCHICHKRRTNRTSRAYNIAIFVRFPNQFLRNDIHHGKSIFDDGIELFVKSSLHNFWKWVAIQFMRFFVCNIADFLLTAWNVWRAFFWRNGADIFTHIRN